jgi:hypothetical protein
LTDGPSYFADLAQTKLALLEELRDKAMRAAAKLPQLLASGPDIAGPATAERQAANPA